MNVENALEKFSDNETKIEILMEQMQQFEQSLNQCKTKLDAIDSEDKSLTNVFKKEFLAEFQVSGGDVDDVNKAFKHAKLDKTIQLMDYLDEVSTHFKKMKMNLLNFRELYFLEFSNN